jgi:type VI protein secretion system component Hcp
MRNALVIAGVLVGAVLAAVLAWAVVGGDGGVRRAALVEPTQSGSIGALTIEGVPGATAMPVRSFNWQFQDGQSSSFKRIEVLRDGGEGSPEIFSFLIGHTAAPFAFLELKAPGSGLPYLRYALVSARSGSYGAGKYEKIVLNYTSMDVRAGQGNAPDPDPSDVVGYMTLREQRVPILDFDVTPTPSDPGHLRADIRRPLDQLADTLNNDLAAGTDLGTVTIELQRPGESEPYVTYGLEGQVRLYGLTDSAAAGVAPTEELKLRFRTMRVSSGRNSACYDAVLATTC